MESIDHAFDVFKAIKAEIASYSSTIVTESDARLKIIDRIMIEVLGWGHGEILTEDPASSGFADYNFRVNGRSRLIVEAKRDGGSFKCANRPAGRGFKLGGPVFNDPIVKGGIRQAILYCGAKNAELACLTNGQEWIVFRGNRLGDGKDTVDGSALVFGSLSIVEDNFALFFDLLSATSVSNYSYRGHFQEAEGQPVRTVIFKKALNPVGTASVLPLSSLASDLDRVMASFFHRLTGDDDPDLLSMCFVDTRESGQADTHLARISEDLLARIKQLETGDSVLLTSLIARAAESRRNEFVVIVGTKGAGKSTFITRFFKHILIEDVAKECHIFRINLGNSPGDVENLVDWLDRALLEEMEEIIFSGMFPTFNELEGIFFDEYSRLKKGPLAKLYETNHAEFQITFGRQIEDLRTKRPHEYIDALVRYVVNSKRKLPVLVFDNADHFDISFQQRAYQYARSIYEANLCLVILPVTDRTSWQLSRHGALQSFEHVSLFLPTPPTSKIIRKRIEFLQDRIAKERERPGERYFLSRGIALSLRDLSAFTESLQAIFLQTSKVSEWIGNLANHDVRRALMLARNFVTSPHLSVDDLLKSYLAGTALEVTTRKATTALIRGHYKVYPVGQNEFVQNIFCLRDEIETTPLLGIRLLRLFEDAPTVEDDTASLDLDQILEYMQGMGVEPRVTQLWLDTMLKTGLCLNFDPTVVDIEFASRLEISPAGRQHLEWARTERQYISAMADVTPIVSEPSFVELREALTRGNQSWIYKIVSFTRYLLAEDANYCTVLDHTAYAGQRAIHEDLRRVANFGGGAPTV